MLTEAAAAVAFAETMPVVLGIGTGTGEEACE